MATEDFKHKLTAILSADIKGFSRLMGEDQKATARTITVCRKVIATVIQKYRARVVDSPRDNFLAGFDTGKDTCFRWQMGEIHSAVQESDTS